MTSLAGSAPASLNCLSNASTMLPSFSIGPSSNGAALSLYEPIVPGHHDSASGDGSLTSLDWQDAPSLVTTLAQSSRNSTGRENLVERSKMRVTQTGESEDGKNEKEGDMDTNGCSLSPQLTAKDCESIVFHTASEPSSDFVDDSGWDVGPGDPWTTCISSSLTLGY